MSLKIFTMRMRLLQSSAMGISAVLQHVLHLTPVVSVSHDPTGHSRGFHIDIPLRLLSLMDIPSSIRKQRTLHA